MSGVEDEVATAADDDDAEKDLVNDEIRWRIVDWRRERLVLDEDVDEERSERSSGFAIFCWEENG